MAQTPRSFAQRLRAFAKDLPRQKNEIKKQIVLEVATQVIGDTPVKTGQARNNYFFTVGRPDNSSVTFGPFGEGRAGGATRGGVQSLGRMRSVIASVKPGQSVYMTNNLEYINRLNAGSSSQAPRGFIEAAIKRGQAIIARQVIRFK